jgi:hypothetical protein
MKRRKRQGHVEEPTNKVVVGEPFNPFGAFRSYIVIPDAILKHSELSSGAKICYGRLLLYAGKQCRCYPRVTSLATELGVSDRSIQLYLKELETQRLIRREQREGRKSNHFDFLWHEIFE